jgi:hypothetical protein
LTPHGDFARAEGHTSVLRANSKLNRAAAIGINGGEMSDSNEFGNPLEGAMFRRLLLCTGTTGDNEDGNRKES